jgi:hypothetical protein
LPKLLGCLFFHVSGHMSKDNLSSPKVCKIFIKIIFIKAGENVYGKSIESAVELEKNRLLL